MLNNGNCETENQAKKPAAFVRRAFQCGNSLPESVVLLPAMPRIGLAAVVFGVRLLDDMRLPGGGGTRKADNRYD